MGKIFADREWNPELDTQKILEMKLREADINELLAAHGEDNRTPNEILVSSLHPQTRLAFADGELFSVYGAVPTTIPDVGIVWAMGTDLITQGGLDMIGWGVAAVRNLFREYEALTNYVDARNEAHIRWLKVMRFRFTGHSVEYSGYPFLHFYKGVDDV